MATRRYMINPEEATFQITETTGASVVSKNIELTVDWDALAALSPAMSGQQARLNVINGLYKMIEYIEQTGKFNVKA
jgi:alkyl sulfatase BDS1-like metallo-beta-lactamase superfamily hydrolase